MYRKVSNHFIIENKNMYFNKKKTKAYIHVFTLRNMLLYYIKSFIRKTCDIIYSLIS